MMLSPRPVALEKVAERVEGWPSSMKRPGGFDTGENISGPVSTTSRRNG
jgi:hypothetical protein